MRLYDANSMESILWMNKKFNVPMFTESSIFPWVYETFVEGGRSDTKHKANRRVCGFFSG